MQFNAVVDQPDESFEQFYQRMFQYYDAHANNIDKFVLDLRFNGGGNGMLVLPFMNEIIKRDKINRLGSFFTLIGRRSYSAAVLFLADLMLHTRTLLVGEPTGAAQNMFSDMRGKGTLPNCGATILLATVYFNFAWPTNKNYTIPPHYPAPFSASDFFSGQDPALNAILADQVKALVTVLESAGPNAAWNYFQQINHNWGAHTNELSITPGTYPIGGNNSCEGTIDDLGYTCLNQNKMAEAQAAFELNAKLFPNSFNVWDSYAECFMKLGDHQHAVAYYRKSLELNPDNTNARDKLRELGESKSFR
ncbi:tetratricopeptide repeat protein [candidate division KSB1 bacterium]|nr:tetratricopeptide repeat protein [candidate division KSB1 bacterium]